MADLPLIRRGLREREPKLIDPQGRRQAAVAVVLRERAAGPELLFIERAEHPDDPWSGHMAFPGGRLDPEDPSPRATAERETREEVGLCLEPAESLGRLDDLEGRHAGRQLPLVISAFVYAAGDTPPLAPNYEVREALWVPLRTVLDPTRHIAYRSPAYGAAAPSLPGIVVGHPERHVVWGLTYRFLELMLSAVGRPLPPRQVGGEGDEGDRAASGS